MVIRFNFDYIKLCSVKTAKCIVYCDLVWATESHIKQTEALLNRLSAYSHSARNSHINSTVPCERERFSQKSAVFPRQGKHNRGGTIVLGHGTRQPGLV